MLLYDFIPKLLKYYTCPPECSAQCCKVLSIPLNENDIQRLKKIDTTIEEKLEDLPDGRKKLSEKPCLFLKEEKCSVYQKRPQSCKIYPIIGTPNVEIDSLEKISIIPCRLGYDIILDIENYCILKGERGSRDVLLRYKGIYKQELKSVKNIFYINVKMLKGFLKYLAEDNRRVEKREELRRELEENLL